MSTASSRRLSGGSGSMRLPKRVKLSASTRLKEITDRQAEIAIQLGSLPQNNNNNNNNNNDEITMTVKENLQKEFHELQGNIAALAKENFDEEEEQRSNNSVAPRQRKPDNLDRARGIFTIHDRDSGVARHALFYRVIKCMNAPLEKMQDLMYCETVQDKYQADFKHLSNDAWGVLAKSISKLANESCMHTGTKSIRGRETFYSEGLSRLLTGFSMRHSLPFLFSHQLACKKDDTADIAAYRTDIAEDDLLGLIEVKKSFDGLEKWQLCGYLSEAFQSQLLHEKQSISFGLTIDQASIKLFGFLWKKEKNGDRPLLEHALLVSNTIVETVKNGGKILQASFLCLAALSDPKVRNQQLSDDYCPLVVSPPGGVFRHSPKVFHDLPKEVMYKLFDYGQYRVASREPNIDVVKTACTTATSAAKCRLLEEEGDYGVSVLTTPWLSGDHTPSCAEHVAKLCDQLQQVHDKNMRHNDVLCQNIVFGFDEQEANNTKKPTANLIDFDYAHLDAYPLFWNTRFPERHPESRSGKATNAFHDVYAAIAILCNFFCFKGEHEQHIHSHFAEGPFVKDKHPELKKEWEDTSAKKVADWIRENSNTLVLKHTETTTTFHELTSSPPEKNVKRA